MFSPRNGSASQNNVSFGSVADTRDYRSSNAYRLHLSIPEIVDTSETRENAPGGVKRECENPSTHGEVGKANGSVIAKEKAPPPKR